MVHSGKTESKKRVSLRPLCYSYAAYDVCHAFISKIAFVLYILYKWLVVLIRYGQASFAWHLCRNSQHFGWRHHLFFCCRFLLSDKMSRTYCTLAASSLLISAIHCLDSSFHSLIYVDAGPLDIISLLRKSKSRGGQTYWLAWLALESIGLFFFF